MERELSNTANIAITCTVLSNSVSLHVKARKITTILGFIAISLFMHVCVFYFLKISHDAAFESELAPLIVTLELKGVDNTHSPLQQLNQPDAEAISKAKIAPSLNIYDLLQQSERLIEQRLRLDKHRADMYQFGESPLDERSLTPDWLQGGYENTHGAFTIEEFKLSDGGTFVKLIYANGSTLCFDVREAAPFDVFGMAIWRFSRCKG